MMRRLRRTLFGIVALSVLGTLLPANSTSAATTYYRLTIWKSGTGTGAVVSTNVGGINCGTTCWFDYAAGTTVTLQASAASGSAFTGWSGPCTGTGTCTVSMTTARTVTATFQKTYSLTIAKSGTGTGSISSSPTALNCISTICPWSFPSGTSISWSFVSGTSVVLTATPTNGSSFAGWSGACSGTGTCTVLMTAAKSVTATFQQVPYSLSVTKSGAGSGTVTSSPSGINCGTVCSTSFLSGTTVVLTATADPGNVFSGWSSYCYGTGSCSVPMTQARSVTATFLPLFDLSVTKAGGGTGTVSSSPSGINCGSTCSAKYAAGTSVTLYATPASGQGFAGWSGACAGTGPCTVSMTQARSVTATFQPVYLVEVVKNGTGGGSVTSSPTGISCSATCSRMSASFLSGTTVILTAVPSAGSAFTGWGGIGWCVSVTATTCTLIVSNPYPSLAQTVYPTFQKIA